MTLYQKSIKIGNWLFRWRGNLPLFLIVIIIPALLRFKYPEGSYSYNLGWEMICLCISFFGLLIRCYTIGHVPKNTSGRNTKIQKAGSLNTTGIYSLMRNPLYMGNFFIYLGIILFVRSWSVIFIYMLAFWIYYERIILAEEEFLKQKYGKDYHDYADHTPLFIPNFKNWQRSVIPFSFRNVLKREYSGFFGIIISFTSLKIISNYIITKKIWLNATWATIFLVGLLIYLTLRTLKKRTRILHVEGR